jgi:hypothetical protein
MSLSRFLQKVFIFCICFWAIDAGSSNLMRRGLDRYYGFNSRPEILINGSSMTLSGFHKSLIEKETNKKVSIYAKEGVGIEERYAMLKHFFSGEGNSVKIVIYELNPLLFSNQLTADNAYMLFYPFMDNDAIDKFIKKKASILDYYTHKYLRSVRFDALTMNFVFKGYFNSYENFKTSSIDPNIAYFPPEQIGKTSIEINKGKLAIFENTIALLAAKKIKVILVMMPIYYQKQATYDPISYANLTAVFNETAERYKDINFVDLNTPDLTYDAALFGDLLHLNREGQKTVTSSIIKLIK